MELRWAAGGALIGENADLNVATFPRDGAPTEERYDWGKKLPGVVNPLPWPWIANAPRAAALIPIPPSGRLVEADKGFALVDGGEKV